MRVWRRLGVFASVLLTSVYLVGACALTTDLDGFSSGGVGATDDGGPGAKDGEPPLTTDAIATPGTEAGTEGGLEAGGPSYAGVVMVDHPVAYFPFDEASTATALAEQLSGKTALLDKEAYTPGIPGIAGAALGLTGKGELEFGDNLDVVGGNPWTIEAWIKPSFEPGKIFYEYFNKRHNGSNGIVCYVRRENGETTVQVEQSFGGGGRGVNGRIPNPPIDRFLHVVFVYDPGGTGVHAWVDGKTGDQGYDDNGGPTDNPQPVYIASGLKGAIDEMAIYDYALPDDRIRAHFAAGRQP